MDNRGRYGKHIVLRADAGARLGSGHIMRCAALAGALAELGAHITLVCREGSLAALPVPLPDNIAVDEVAAAIADDPAALGARLGHADWLVVDSYHWNADLESACRSWAKRILVIDDLADRRHDTDLLLNQNPGWSRTDYDGLVPENAVCLIGPRFALLRHEFAAARPTALARRETAAAVDKVLISLGGADPSGATIACIEATAAAFRDRPNVPAVDIATGPAAHNLAEITTLLAERLPTARLLVGGESLCELMARADLMIGAGGGTMLERACLGLPSMSLVIANNQRRGTAATASGGATMMVDAIDAEPGQLVQTIASTLARLADDSETRRLMTQAAAKLCDGRGARWVAAAMTGCGPASAVPGTILRPADADDCARLLAWQSEPGARRYSRNPAVPGEEEHRAWMDRHLADPAGWFAIVETNGSSAGVLRLDACASDNSVPHFEISILIGQAHRGKGLARTALACAEALAPNTVLEAEVDPDNAPSRALFSAAGYQAADTRRYLRDTRQPGRFAA